MKTLWLAVLLASPPLAVWTLRGGGEKAAAPEIAAPPVERVAVEVLSTDGRKEWVMVEVPHEVVPEPSSAVLMMFSVLLLLRRQRGK
jgi:hypothetical protein